MFRSARSTRTLRRRGAAHATVQIAPLIDMVFILLIFFMVTGTLVPDTGLEIERPRSSHAQALDARSLRISVTESGAVFADGERLDLVELRERVARFVRGEAEPSVIIIPDELTPSGKLVEVMDIAKTAGAHDLAVATREREE